MTPVSLGDIALLGILIILIICAVADNVNL